MTKIMEHEQENEERKKNYMVRFSRFCFCRLRLKSIKIVDKEYSILSLDILHCTYCYLFDLQQNCFALFHFSVMSTFRDYTHTHTKCQSSHP